MATPSTIQRVAKGLQDLLGMKAFGDYPKLLAEEVRTVVDVAKLYTADRLKTAQSGTAASISGIGTSNAPPTSSVWVPQGELWLVTDISWQVSTAVPAATTIRGRVFKQTSSQVPTILTCLGTPLTLAAGEFGNTGYHFDDPDIWLPGDTLGVFTESFTGAGPVTGNFLQLLYARIVI